MKGIRDLASRILDWGKRAFHRRAGLADVRAARKADRLDLTREQKDWLINHIYQREEGDSYLERYERAKAMLTEASAGPPLTEFQQKVLKAMVPGVWYNAKQYRNGGANLPPWFYREQTNPHSTLNSMVRKGAIRKKVIYHEPTKRKRALFMKPEQEKR